MTDETNGPGREPLGRCCYGGQRPKSACASCAAWSPLAAPPAAAPRFCPNGRECFRQHLLDRADEMIKEMDEPTPAPAPADALENALELLSVARCPQKCTDGTTPYGEQCQWCDERAALAAHRKGKS